MRGLGEGFGVSLGIEIVEEWSEQLGDYAEVKMAW